MKYVCKVCGFVYDEDKQSTKFKDLPVDWKCPVCKASKDQFKGDGEDANQIKDLDLSSDEVKLSMKEYACLFTNLARGCEKQYKGKEAEKFRELAAYFDSIAPRENESLMTLINLLKDDLDSGYATVTKVSKENGDRGSQRVCVWGEKVSNMIQSTIDRYLKEGSSLLENNEIWVCTVCGFIYIGENPPSLCPVCKVPDWKFEKIERKSV